jgi:hypothetical protein
MVPTDFPNAEIYPLFWSINILFSIEVIKALVLLFPCIHHSLAVEQEIRNFHIISDAIPEHFNYCGSMTIN